MIAVVAPGLLIGAQAPNMRGNATKTDVRNQDAESNAVLRRSATSVIARNVSVNNRTARPVVTARPANMQSVKVRSARPITNNVNKTRSATKSELVRSAKSSSNVSRGGIARATAIFNDTTKIGGGYSECRDSYATCMDQFCAAANDTYRRCYCSDRFMNFRETSDKLDSALQMLADFQNTNLEMVDKTAAEVNAMYTATDGEKAIKKDTSASQKLLDSIGDVLSGKKTTKSQGLNSLGVLDFTGFDDIWGNDGFSIFDGNNSTNLSDLEGKELYDNAAKQCAEITRESCGSDAMFNLARSAYSIMVTQDCNVYEKNINAKRASVEETIRTAEKYLRDARLDEYRAHNSADVNECLAKVESAIRQPVVCGENYEKCMDYTGKYINANTGEPIYSMALFELNKLITLDGSADVLGANPNFEKELEKKRQFAASALNTCRDVADTVWYEFKRSALIQIAQAQDEKIQQVKDACVTTIKACYDKQSGALKDMDTTKTQSTDAISATVARGMCYDKVMACAALYGDTNGCKYDNVNKTLTAVEGKKCGLQSLLTFVDTVDSVKVAEGCETALTKYAHELCDPKLGADSDVVYPAGCATTPRAQLRAAMELRRKTFCVDDLVNNDNSNTLQANDAFNTNIMNQIIENIYDELQIALVSGCEDKGGVWVSEKDGSTPEISVLVQDFYKTYYGTTITNVSQIADLNLSENGWCIMSNEQAQCNTLSSNYAKWTGTQCELQPAWYPHACDMLGGTWNNNECQINWSTTGGNNSSNTGTSTAHGGVYWSTTGGNNSSNTGTSTAHGGVYINSGFSDHVYKEPEYSKEIQENDLPTVTLSINAMPVSPATN